MSKSRDMHKPLLRSGNPFRMFLPKGGYHAPLLLGLLNTFEVSLAEKLRRLKPANGEEMLHLPWMKSAMELLSEVHEEIKDIITALELPANHWKDKWIDAYFVSSEKLLGICNALSTEMIRLQYGRLFLDTAVRCLKDGSSEDFVEANSSLSKWRQAIAPKNPKLEESFYVMEGMAATLDLPTIKKSGKGKVLMRAIYGMKVVSILVCSILAATLSGSTKKLMYVQVSRKYKWAGAFTDLQSFLNAEIRNVNMNGMVVVKERQAVDATVKKLYPYTEAGVDSIKGLGFQSSKEDFEKSVEIFGKELYLLEKEVRRFFSMLLRGRNAMLDHLRIGGKCDQK